MRKFVCLMLVVVIALSSVFFAYAESDKFVTGISVCTLPDKREYSYGETVDPAGMSLYVFYSDGSNEIITDGFTLTDEVINQLGNRPVTVNYEGFTDVFYVQGYYKTYQKVLSIVSFLVSFFAVSFRNILEWF